MVETVEFRKGVLFFRLKGNCFETKEVFSYLLNLIEEVGIRYISLNLSQVTSINETGITLIDLLDQHLQAKGGELILCGGNTFESCFKQKPKQWVKDELNVFSVVQL